MTDDLQWDNVHADGWTPQEKGHRNRMVKGSKDLLNELWYRHPNIMRHLTGKKGL